MFGASKCRACRASGDECDLQHPKCSSCIARSVTCTYVSGATEFTFVSQNEAAATASRRAARRRSLATRRKTVELDVSSLEAGPGVVVVAAQQSPTLATPILYNVEDRVVQRFLARWAAGQTSLGCLDTMPQLFQSSAQYSAVRKSIMATAYADLVVFERNGERATKCYQAYFGALGRLREELSATGFIATDVIFAAVLTIDAFELLYMGRTDPLGIHTTAILRLLELRKNQFVNHKTDFSLWRSAHQRIHVRQMLCEMPEFSALSMHDLSDEDNERLEVQTIKFVADTNEVLSRLQRERSRPAEQRDGEEIARLGNALRHLVEDAHRRCENNDALPLLKRTPLDVNSDPDLIRVFPNVHAILYDDFWMARDRLLFNICNIKILDVLLDLRTEEFSSIFSNIGDTDRSRTFLLAAQPDLAELQTRCRFALDIVPLFIGLVDYNGNSKTAPWILNDTGVLTVKSVLRAIGQIKYVSPEITDEANTVFEFLNTHRHVIPLVTT